MLIDGNFVDPAKVEGVTKIVHDGGVYRSAFSIGNGQELVSLTQTYSIILTSGIIHMAATLKPNKGETFEELNARLHEKFRVERDLLLDAIDELSKPKPAELLAPVE